MPKRNYLDAPNEIVRSYRVRKRRRVQAQPLHTGTTKEKEKTDEKKELPVIKCQILTRPKYGNWVAVMEGYIRKCACWSCGDLLTRQADPVEGEDRQRRLDRLVEDSHVFECPLNDPLSDDD